MIKQMVMVLVLLLAVSAVPAMAYPTLSGYVNDFAGILTPQEEVALAAQAGLVEQNTTVQIAIVTVQTTNGEDTILYGAHTGDQNGVGQAATDNGVVVVYSLANEAGGGIATGRGIESTLTDYAVSNIGRGAHPYFVQKRYYEGFSYIISEIDKKVEPANASATTGNADPNVMPIAILIALVVGGIILTAIVLAAAARNERRLDRIDYSDHPHVRDAATAATVGSVLTSRRRYRSDDDDDDDSGFSSSHDSGDHDSGGGGFGGFGGGSFGGGGGHF